MWASQVELVVKNPPANAGDLKDVGSIPVSGKIPWRRAWQPTPVFLPGESYGQRSLVGLLALEPRLNIMVHRPSCSLACGIFPYQGSKMCSLHWHKNSHPLYLQVSPISDSWPENILDPWNGKIPHAREQLGLCTIILSLGSKASKPTRLLGPWGFSRQEYWSVLSCPPLWDLPNPGIKPRSPALWADFTVRATREAQEYWSG